MYRPVSRESTTSFPAGNPSLSNSSNERLGAFGALQLDRHSVPSPNRPTGLPPHMRTHSQPQTFDYSQNPTPSPARTPTHQNGSARSSPLYMPRPTHLHVNINDPRNDNVYNATTTHSNADTSESRRKYDKLSEVYSTSGDTVEFARNLNDYLSEKIPPFLSISILTILCLVSFVFILLGTFNLPFCHVQPLIPIWLIVAGVLFICSAIFRIYYAVPAPPTNRARKNLSGDLCCRGFELLFFLANVVWLILGCVWVYGAKPYVNFREGMFEEHYCEPGLYWTAFSAVTFYLVMVCFLIVAIICLLGFSSYKEASEQTEALDVRR